MKIIDNPFKPGARVAISTRYTNEVHESFVEKLYKSGRFTLRGSAQQWKPYCWGVDQAWSATETGSGYVRGHLKIWDETTDAEITSRIAEQKLRARWDKIRHRVGSVDRKNVTEEVCDAIEAALTKVKS
jgi:hypothetical protein